MDTNRNDISSAPPPVAMPPAAAAHEAMPALPTNSSGARNGIPVEIAQLKWNWGAFLMNALWCFKHGYQSLGTAFIAIVMVRCVFDAHVPDPISTVIDILCTLALLVIAIYLGLCGNTIAWENRRFEGGYGQFVAVQRRWAMYGIVVNTCIIVVATMMLFNTANPTAQNPPVNTAAPAPATAPAQPAGQ